MGDKYEQNLVLRREHDALLSVLRQCVEAVGDYMSQFGQGLEAHDIPFGPAQKSADEKVRAALVAARELLEVTHE